MGELQKAEEKATCEARDLKNPLDKQLEDQEANKAEMEERLELQAASSKVKVPNTYLRIGKTGEGKGLILNYSLNTSPPLFLQEEFAEERLRKEPQELDKKFNEELQKAEE